MISADAITQTINLGITCALSIVFYIAFFLKNDAIDSVEPRPRSIYLVLVGMLFLGIGLIAAFLSDRPIADGLFLKYPSFGAGAFCAFYACYLAWIIGHLHVFIKWLAQCLGIRKKHDEDDK
jgi:hypothetical protein